MENPEEHKAEWFTRQAIEKKLSISRATFFRAVKAGDFGPGNVIRVGKGQGSFRVSEAGYRHYQALKEEKINL